MYYVYLIECSKSDKFYIGYTNNYERRWSAHKCSAIRNHGKSKLYCHMRKYGIENYEMILVERFKDRQQALDYEVKLISELDQSLLLNLAPGGENSFGVSDENKDRWKAKLSEARQGRKPALGMKHTEENKQFFSECGRKRWEGKTYPTDVTDYSFKDASKLFGISKTHYYRLLKQAKINDLG